MLLWGELHIRKPPQTKSRIDFRRHSPTAGRFNQAKYWQFGVQYRLYYGRIICALNPRIKSSRYSIFFKSLILQFCQLQRTSNEIYLNIVSVFFCARDQFWVFKISPKSLENFSLWSWWGRRFFALIFCLMIARAKPNWSERNSASKSALQIHNRARILFCEALSLKNFPFSISPVFKMGD